MERAASIRRQATRGALLILVALTIQLSARQLGYGQQRPISGVSGNISDRERSLRDRERDMRANESELLDRSGRSTRPTSASAESRMAQTVKQIREDFERIQILNLNLKEKYTPTNVFNYQGVAADAEEIKKRARRLKTNLALPKIKPEKAVWGLTPVEEATLPRTLGELSAAIKQFVNNPYFLNPNIIDAQHLNTTRDSLDRVIYLSEQISKQAKKGGKSAPSAARR